MNQKTNELEQKGIAIAGNIILDIVNEIDVYPERGMLATIRKKNYAAGGCVPNVGIPLVKMDRSLSVQGIGKVGKDEYGEYLLKKLQEEGLDIRGIGVTPDRPTSSTDVMFEKESKARTFFHTRGACNGFDLEDIALNDLSCKIFHIGYILLMDRLDEPEPEFGTRMGRLLHAVSERGIKTSVDVVSEDGERFREKVIPALKYCDYTILNEIECCRAIGLSPRRSDGTLQVQEIRKAMEGFLEYGVREKVIVHSPEAGFLMDKEGNFTCIPSLKLPEGFIKGTCGAGDAFAAGSLYGLYQDYDASHLLAFAAATAACSLAGSDAYSAIPSFQEIEEMSNRFERQPMPV